MFSYFKGGIKKIIPVKKIGMEALVKEIRTNSCELIHCIRALDKNAVNYDESKNRLKRNLSYITPNCTVKKRTDNDIIQYSGYLYFDIDYVEDAAKYKQDLIRKYHESICMLCISSSGQGLSLFVKLENEITDDNFKMAREYLISNLFPDLPLDNKTKDKSRAWFVSFDPDCYYNPSSVICIPPEKLFENSSSIESAKSKINTYSNDSSLFAPFPYKYRNDWSAKLKFSTEVEISNPIFDLRPVEYCEVFIRPNYKIPKGKKQKFFSQVIHNLVYLNPGISADYIYSYILFLNKKHTEAESAADLNDLRRLFLMVYNGIRENGELKPSTRIKYFHCRTKTIAPDELRSLAMKMTGLYKRNESIRIIQYAKELLGKEGAEFEINNYLNDSLLFAPCNATQRNVHLLINRLAKENGKKGIGIRTVKTYWKETIMDLDAIVKAQNEAIELTYISR